jgi:hypothetical protein
VATTAQATATTLPPATTAAPPTTAPPASTAPVTTPEPSEEDLASAAVTYIETVAVFTGRSRHHLPPSGEQEVRHAAVRHCI